MVAENFDASLKRVRVHEGGYSNDRDDPGGGTIFKFAISTTVSPSNGGNKNHSIYWT